MQKHMRKKRPTKKPARVPKMLAPIHWTGILVALTVFSGCLLLVALATNRPSTPAPAPPARSTNIYSPMPLAGDTPAAQQTLGIFPLSVGGPIPVPANVLHPTNIARVLVNNVLMSVYAGSMTRTPAVGVLAILQENLVTGQQSLHLYQTSQPVGELTILAIHNSLLTLSTARTNGTFNLVTDQFSFSRSHRP